MPPINILIADDDRGIHSLFREIFGPKKWTVDFVDNGPQALDSLCTGQYDIAIVDLYMPGLSGLEVLEGVREKGINTHLILMTGFGTRKGTLQKAVQALKIGAIDIIEKPFRRDILISTVERFLKRISISPHVLPERLDSFLEEHAFEPSLSLSDLCEHFRISGRYVAKLFRQHLGTSFRKRLSYYRVQKAKQLIESTDEPLYSIAEKCGFNSYRQLTAAFHRLEGMPPRKYREICSDKPTKYS